MWATVLESAFHRGEGKTNIKIPKKREDTDSNYTQIQGPGTFVLTHRATQLFDPPGKSPNLPSLAANLDIIA